MHAAATAQVTLEEILNDRRTFVILAARFPFGIRTTVAE
jgi:hypothetical protein